MGWIRRNSSSSSDECSTKRLEQSCSSTSTGRGVESNSKKGGVAVEAGRGYVPMLVGREGEEAEMVMVHVKTLSSPGVARLLEAAAAEFGYRQRGVLRVPCAAGLFREMLSVAR